MIRLYSISWVALALLAGCQSSLYSDFYDKPKSLPPIGSTIDLHQTLFVRPGFSRSFIQYGKAMDDRGVYQRQPWCQFYLYESQQALQTERTILPDQFTVTESYQWVNSTVSPPIKVASTSAFGHMFHHDVSAQTLKTIIKLESDKQPHVIELQCAVFKEPYYYNYLSVRDIQKTLGEVVTLHLK